ncbi:MAG TPA: 3-dehydroquinate synthase, partial [Porticoccaceae bacterium]|nr:3-dehydroquinate synthase [Porticoccaceae bacterium]
LLAACALPIAPPKAMGADDFMRLMVRDKKVLDGQLRLVLLKRIGEAYISNTFSLDNLQALVSR